MKFLTEERLERRAEQLMDRLDQALISGEISQEVYDEEVRKLCRHISARYHLLRQHQLAVN
jgi:hypothetical protein